MEEAVQINNRDDFVEWAIEVARQIVTEQGFELAHAARNGGDEDMQAAGITLGQTVADTLMEVYDSLTDETPDE